MYLCTAITDFSSFTGNDVSSIDAAWSRIDAESGAGASDDLTLLLVSC